METITILLVCGAFLGLVAQYLIKEPPFYLMSELLGLGGIVSLIDEVNANTLGDTPAMLLIIGMVSIMIYSTWGLVNYYAPNGKKKRF